MSAVDPSAVTLGRSDATRLSLGEATIGCQIGLKSALVDLDRLARAYLVEKLPAHEPALRAAIGSVKDAIRSLDQASAGAGAELALRLEQALPGHDEKEATT